MLTAGPVGGPVCAFEDFQRRSGATGGLSHCSSTRRYRTNFTSHSSGLLSAIMLRGVPVPPVHTQISRGPS